VTNVSKGKKTIQIKTSMDYVRAFVEIDSLKELNQPKSSREKVLKVKESARRDMQVGYFIKAVREELSLIEQMETREASLKMQIQLLQSEIGKGNEVFNIYLHMEMADVLKHGFANNHWQSRQKIADDSNADPANWSLEKLHRDIRWHIEKSLLLADGYAVEPYLKPIVSNSMDYQLSLTVKQVMAMAGITILDNMILPAPVTYVSPSKEDAFSEKDVFLKKDFKVSSDPKNEYMTLRLYQFVLENYHLYFDLKRLDYARGKYPDSDTYFVNASENLLNKHESDSFSNLVAIKLATYYTEPAPVKSLDIIASALKHHPGFSFNRSLEGIRQDIMQPVIGTELEALNQPGKDMLAKFTYKNLTKVYVRAYKIDYLDYTRNVQGYYEGNDDMRRKTFAYIQKLQLIAPAYTVTLPDFGDYKLHSADVGLKALPEGMHLVLISDSEHIDEAKVAVFSSVSVSRFALSHKGKQIQVLDARDGQLQSGKAYKVYQGNNYGQQNSSHDLIKSGTTDAKGMIEIPEQKQWGIHYILEVEGHVVYDNYFYRNVPVVGEKDNLQVALLTDRAIYRPGQKVYVKAIAYMGQSKKTVSGKQLTLTLKDNNGQDKGKLVLTTNTYGSANGHFILPASGFNSGDFYIETTNGYAGFKVEEYKRPKYTATILKPETAYKLNDDVKITGEARALAGYAIQGAQLVYTVKRKERPRYWWYGFRGPKSIPASADEQMIKTGNLQTDADGRFVIEFKAIPDPKISPDQNPYFIFEIAVTVTDLNGETRTAAYDMTMAYTDREINISGQQDYINNEKKELVFSAKNLQEQPLPFTGKILLKKVVSTGAVKRERLWGRSDTMAMTEQEFLNRFPDYLSPWKKEETTEVKEQSFTNDLAGKWDVSKLANVPGEYVAIMSTTDGRGKSIETEFRFTVSASDPSPFNQPLALKVSIVNGKTFEPGQTARLLVAGGVEKAVARVRISGKNGLQMEKEIIVSKNAQLIDIPVKAADRGNLIVNVDMISDYRVYRANTSVSVPYSNKQLQVRLSSFRNDMEPGSKEKWTMTVKGPVSEVAAIETAAVMYDQSLDELYKGQGWEIFNNLYPDNYAEDRLEYNMNSKTAGTLVSARMYEAYDEFYMTYPVLEGIGDWGWGYGSGAGSGLNYAASPQVRSKNLEKSANIGYMDLSEADKENNKPEPASNTTVTSEPVIRKNFNETAFFYPALYANAKGEISFEFTMPEALTKWKMMMLAHSTTMQVGYAEQSVTTSKKIMVQPNMPRFLRQGDKISIAAKIVNTTNEKVSAKVSIKITDEESGKVLSWLKSANDLSVSIPANGSSAATFSLDIPAYSGVVSVAIYASSSSFSDGEQNALLVLPNRSLIAETMAVTIRKGGTQNIEFSSLKNNNSVTLTNEKLSVEMSANPAWYAVQSLPYMMEYPHECAEQVFTRLYANGIAVSIANSDPSIKKIYETWEREAANGNGLQSKLLQNQDLKTTLIEETPWLREANNETERMKRLGNLFNSAKMKLELDAAFDKLKNMQLSNGAWPWFTGMGENAYITQTIVIGFGKMKKMGVDINLYQSMIDKAIKYLDEQARKDYNYYRSLKEFKDFYPANLQYLYAKSYFPAKGLTDTSRVLQYFLTNAEKTWSGNSLLNMAQLATAIHLLKPTSAVPALIIKSLQENAKQTDEMGMYWPKNTGGWYWYEAPVETQAAIIETFSLLDRDKTMVREQQIWLLRQKQTQSWKTTRSTADACYALLMNGQLLSSKQKIEVSVNKTPLKPARQEAGTGYFRQDIPKSDISRQSADITVNAATDDFAYGAVYWQYFEDMDKVKSAGAGLGIVKRLYKVTHTASGDQKTEVKEGEVLHIGDIIEVSLQISSDRRLDFVHIKDLRASGTEPSDVLSTYHWQNGLGYYQSTRDASTNFFIDNMPKGNFQLNYTLRVEQAGVFNSGMATAQCMYAPEYAANSTAIILKVE
jgi:uncharacterized protein YfaS (alpha-2-macroglobulin family)